MSELIPWTRTGELFPTLFRDRFFREFDDLMDRFHGEEPFLTGFTPTFSPAIDISETDDASPVKGEIPGVDSKDLHISLTGEVLTITGERKEEDEAGNGGTPQKRTALRELHPQIHPPLRGREGRDIGRLRKRSSRAHSPKNGNGKKEGDTHRSEELIDDAAQPRSQLRFWEREARLAVIMEANSRIPGS